MAAPESFDVAILGTGLTECILAGALARAGKRVLHLDTLDHYGAQLAARHAADFLAAVAALPDSEIGVSSSAPQSASDEQPVLGADGDSEALAAQLAAAPDAAEWVARLCGDAVPESPERLREARFVASLIARARHFNLELVPAVLYSRGPIVDLLVSSRVGPYLEFKLLNDMFFEWDQEMEKVPSGKDDIFVSKTKDLLAKRRLMKFLTMALNYLDNEHAWQEHANRPFCEFLAGQGLDPKMSAVIMHAIALVGDADEAATITTADGLERTHRHLNSLGRYGKRAFLVGMYGTGSELCQAFSRYCAVFGGLYILGFQPDSIESTDEGVCIKGQDQTFVADSLVVGAEHAAKLPVPVKLVETALWRATIISNAPVLGTTELSMAALPPQEGARENGVFAIQLSADTCTCPEGLYTVSIISHSSKSTKQDLKDALISLHAHQARLQSASVWLDAVYQIKHIKPETEDAFMDKRIAVCSSPSGQIVLEDHVAEARRLFERICPGAIFYPEEAQPPEDE
ncbi:hypothetical protein HK105_202967 [Polyrhizophydium stewartii]|uniref:Rab proteins geranylgeranyltransferase component A n=1 Tax=Polyrhizophydium stewartii TaxID=2732419 RepID=A0ABR4NCQ3_9FUNG|nr:hypothetical protein HK105_006248 [Polyrhizophydium stewartii]